MEGDVVTKAQPMKNYVVNATLYFEFKAVSWGDAKRIGKFKLKEVGVPVEDAGIVCEETGEEESL